MTYKAATSSREPFPELECPHCERMTPPRSLNRDGSVTYTCGARHHQATHGLPQTWRITVDGSFLEKTKADTLPEPV